MELPPSYIFSKTPSSGSLWMMWLSDYRLKLKAPVPDYREALIL